MDLITNSIQRAFTAKCVAGVREETDKKRVSNPATVDTSKVLYEAGSVSFKRIKKSLPILKVNFKKRGLYWQ